MYFEVVFPHKKVVYFITYHKQCLMLSYQQFFILMSVLQLPHSEYLISHISKD